MISKRTIAAIAFLSIPLTGCFNPGELPDAPQGTGYQHSGDTLNDGVVFETSFKPKSDGQPQQTFGGASRFWEGSNNA